MRKVISILLLMVSGAFGVLFASAQGTGTGDAEQAVTTIRIVYLSPDGPTLVPYVNGEPSNIQMLTFPSSSGWVEVPGNSFDLALIPQGATQNQAAVGPVTITSADSWTTILVTGSAADGTLQAYSVRENVAHIPTGCARMTIFHTIEDAPPIDVTLADGTVLAAGLSFPGGERAEGQEVASLTGCESAAQDSTQADDVTSSTDLTTTGALDCRTLAPGVTTVDGDTTSQETTETEDADQETAETEAADQTATDEQSVAIARGPVFANCGYTFDVRAGTYDIQVKASDSGNTLLSLPGLELVADSYYFVAATGTSGAPEVFRLIFEGESLESLLGENDPVIEATAEVTPTLAVSKPYP